MTDTKITDQMVYENLIDAFNKNKKLKWKAVFNSNYQPIFIMTVQYSSPIMDTQEFKIRLFKDKDDIHLTIDDHKMYPLETANKNEYYNVLTSLYNQLNKKLEEYMTCIFSHNMAINYE